MLDHDEFDTVFFRCRFGALSSTALVYKGYLNVFTRHLLYLGGQMLYLSTLLLISGSHHQRKEQPQCVYGGVYF
jgi:hypothetical protein